MPKRDIHVHIHTADNGAFESQHPRGKGGRFGSGGATEPVQRGHHSTHHASMVEHTERMQHHVAEGKKAMAAGNEALAAAHETAAEAHRNVGVHRNNRAQAQAAASVKEAKEAEAQVERIKAKAGGQSVEEHANYSKADYEALKAKGYTDKEILEVWDRDLSRGHQGPNSRKDLKLPPSGRR